MHCVSTTKDSAIHHPATSWERKRAGWAVSQLLQTPPQEESHQAWNANIWMAGAIYSIALYCGPHEWYDNYFFLCIASHMRHMFALQVQPSSQSRHSIHQWCYGHSIQCGGAWGGSWWNSTYFLANTYLPTASLLADVLRSPAPMQLHRSRASLRASYIALWAFQPSQLARQTPTHSSLAVGPRAWLLVTGLSTITIQ